VQTTNKIHIAIGLLTAAIGTIPLLVVMGVLPSRPPAPGDDPAWLAAAVGWTFFLGGMAVIAKSFAGADASSGELPGNAPRALRAVYDLMVTAIPILLAVLFSWVAFGPGERHFSVSGGSGGSAVAMPVPGGGQIIGRVAFGFAAVLGWVIAGWTIVSMARRWFSRRQSAIR
jgi:hypothetical protein